MKTVSALVLVLCATVAVVDSTQQRGLRNNEQAANLMKIADETKSAPKWEAHQVADLSDLRAFEAESPDVFVAQASVSVESTSTVSDATGSNSANTVFGFHTGHFGSLSSEVTWIAKQGSLAAGTVILVVGAVFLTMTVVARHVQQSARKQQEELLHQSNRTTAERRRQTYTNFEELNSSSNCVV